VSIFLRSVEKNTCVNPFCFVFRFGHGTTDMDRLRFFVFRKLLAGCTFKTGLLRVLTLVFRPVVVTVLSFRCLRRFYRPIKKTFGIGKVRFFFSMLWVCLTHHVTPMYYCRHQFYQKESGDYDAYLFGNEASVLLPQLNDDPCSDIVDDKEKFYEICAANGLPIPLIFGVIGTDGTAPEFLHEDIVVKPVRGSKGEGMEIWKYQNERYIGPEENVPDASSLFDVLRSRVCTDGNRLIVQRRLWNHPALVDLSKSALITVRIVTYRDPEGAFRVLNECLILPLEGESGGIRQAVAPILEDTGRLGVAVPYGVIRKELAIHPVYGLPILDVPVPFREESRSLAIRAHSFFPDFFSLGWDIAITGDGPIILETNRVWDAETAQRPNRRPISQTDWISAAVTVVRNKKSVKFAGDRSIDGGTCGSSDGS